MTIENIALVDERGYVINHVVVDTDDTETLNALHERWGTERYVVTTTDDLVILHESDEIWTEHCDNESCPNHGFNLPSMEVYLPAIGIEIKKIERKRSELPADSLLLEANAANRPEGWVYPSNILVVEG